MKNVWPKLEKKVSKNPPASQRLFSVMNLKNDMKPCEENGLQIEPNRGFGCPACKRWAAGCHKKSGVSPALSSTCRWNARRLLPGVELSRGKFCRRMLHPEIACRRCQYIRGQHPAQQIAWT
ncbi:hypothetical protein [Pararhizobium haloflavum]|uniref:hypothetical protein n=1 Tax=Pararhizobium haloflavum TaxID=2037914 RepID=UPI0018E45F82|nr:hypothetical protein [Pararhizobium haloflavum]